MTLLNAVDVNTPKEIKKNRLNLDITKALRTLTATGASSRGDNFTETVTNTLKSNIKDAKVVSPKEWKTLLSKAAFKSHRHSCSNYKFDFSQLTPSIAEYFNSDILIVEQPNGKNRWPDQLIIAFNVGLPIEVKSQKIDGITWNGGLPRDNAIYIYNCYGLSKTTCFMGQDVISAQNKKEMQLYASLIEQINLANVTEDDDGDKFTYYPRHMFNSTKKFFEGESSKEQIYELECLNLELTDQKEKLITHLTVKSQVAVDEINNKISENLQKISNLQKAASPGRAKTQKRESNVYNYVNNLNWDSSQYSDFSENESFVKSVLEDGIQTINSLDNKITAIFEVKK